MKSDFDESLEDVEHAITESLIRHLDAKFHPYTLAAIGAAIVVMNAVDDEDEDVAMEETISRSCQIFFGFTLAFMRRIQKDLQEEFWKSNIAIAKEIYGDDLTQTAATLAIQNMREFEDELSEDLTQTSRLN